MPMTAESVAIYLAVVMVGGAVIGIADSFARHEIKTRLRVANADAVITQDALFRGNKYIPLYEILSPSNLQTIAAAADWIDLYQPE